MATFERMANTNSLIWNLSTWDELSKEDWHECVKARIDVFVVEQTCPYPELDGKDKDSWHLFAQEKGGGEVLAYLRILPKGLSYDEMSIGRVLSAAAVRGKGVGKELMSRAIDWLDTNKPNEPIRISAQVPQIKWYNQWGFATQGESYLEDDIPHIEMRRN